MPLKKKTTPKKKKIVSSNKHFKRIANRSYSEWIQRLINEFDEQWLSTNVQREICFMPNAIQAYFDEVCMDFGSFLRKKYEEDKIDLHTIKCKEMYSVMIEFSNTKYDDFFHEDNFDNLFFASSYVIATVCLSERPFRKLFGVRKGLFG